MLEHHIAWAKKPPHLEEQGLHHGFMWTFQDY